MRVIFQTISDWLSPKYSTDFDYIAHPYKTGDERPKRNIATNPNIHHVEDTGTKTLLLKDEEAKEWKVSKDLSELERSSLITKEDEAIILSNNLKIEKYKKIKAEWAKGKGIILISKAIKERGYSESVVKKYVKHINQANPSPATDRSPTASGSA